MSNATSATSNERSFYFLSPIFFEENADDYKNPAKNFLIMSSMVRENIEMSHENVLIINISAQQKKLGSRDRKMVYRKLLM